MGQTAFTHSLLTLSFFVLNCVKNRSHGKTEKCQNPTIPTNQVSQETKLLLCSLKLLSGRPRLYQRENYQAL